MITAVRPLHEFLADAEAFLRRHAPPRPRAETRCWRSTLFEAGLAWIDGPPEYGGAGLPGPYARAYAALERSDLASVRSARPARSSARP